MAADRVHCVWLNLMALFIFLLVFLLTTTLSQDEKLNLSKYPDHLRVVAIFGNSPTSNYDLAAAKLFAYVEKELIFNRTRLMITIIQLPQNTNVLSTTGYLCAELQTASNLIGFIVSSLEPSIWTYVIELARGWGIPMIDVSRNPALNSPQTDFLLSSGRSRGSRQRTKSRLFVNNPAMLVRLHPSSRNVATAIQDVVSAYKWRQLVFLYDKKSNLMALHNLIGENVKSSSVRETTMVEVSEENLFDVVKIALKVNEWKTVVVAFDEVMTIKFLKMALRCGMLSSTYSFILANPEIHLYSFEEFAQNWPNITIFRPIVDSPVSRTRLKDARAFESIQPTYRFIVDRELVDVEGKFKLPAKLNFNRQFPFHFTSALVIDALMLYKEAVSITLPNFFDWISVQPERFLTCSRPYPLLNGYGDFLFDTMRNTSLFGLSGPLDLQPMSLKRSRVTMDVLGLSGNGLIKIGEWTSSKRGVLHDADDMRMSKFKWRPFSHEDDIHFLQLMIPPSDQNALHQALHTAQIRKMTIRVTTVLEKPYAMVKRKSGASNSRAVVQHNYEGFCIDLLDSIASIVGFNYILNEVHDGSYGKYDNSTGRWNGMIGEIHENVADMAVAPLTITYAREQVVDFTKPFLQLGISILYVTPKAAPPSLFSFMDPLAGRVWMAISFSGIAVIAIFFVVGRITPIEHDFTDKEVCEHEKHPYTIAGSAWFVVGGFFGLGSEITPMAMSTRLVTCAWWFFSLIIISSYTANLAAFLTIEQQISPFENIEQLAAQTDILYGTRKGGSTENFFREASIQIYRDMWHFMKDKRVFAASNAEAIERVREEGGGYAYFMESVSLQYALKDRQQNKDCTLRQVGGLIDSKGYGIAVPLGSPFRDIISMAILEMQESDKLAVLYDRWWASDGAECNTEKGQGAIPMGMKNVLGIFVVLSFGFAGGVIFMVIEVLCNARKARAGQQNNLANFCHRLCNYLELAFRYWLKQTRPAPHRIGKENESNADELQIKREDGKTDIVPWIAVFRRKAIPQF